jgi:hypothetical protein
MHKAARLSSKLEQLNIAEAMKEIENSRSEALYFDVIADAMCIMHDDGSANIIESAGNGVFTSAIISPEDILRILHHYRPFKELFKSNMQ